MTHAARPGPVSEPQDLSAEERNDDAATPAVWVDVASRPALAEKGRMIVKTNGKQILLLDAGDTVYACNNRCPHEGFPLMEGTVADSCVLTCDWHNWKFDLSSGETLVGGDSLRPYPVSIEGDRILIDVADPPADRQIRKALDSLHESFERHEYDRMAREIARLMKAGGDPAEAVRAAIHWTADKFEFGATHALAAAPDWMALADHFKTAGADEETALAPLVEIVGHFCWDTLRWGHFPYPDAVADTFDAAALETAIEAEDHATAFAQVRAGLATGDPVGALDGPLSRAAVAHYQDFGHSLIYVLKTRELIERLGADVAEPLYLMLTRALLYASREDLIPEFRGYAAARAAWDETLAKGAGTETPDPETLRKSGVDKAMAQVVASAADTDALYDALLTAAAGQFLRADTAGMARWDRSVSQNFNWLDFTHALTFANAGRLQGARHPEIMPAVLLQIACFLGRNVGYVDETVEEAEWHVDAPESFLRDALDGTIDHGIAEYIISCHHVKLLTALVSERTDQPGRSWDAPALAAANRFLSSPLKRRHVRRTARQALAFVAAEG